MFLMQITATTVPKESAVMEKRRDESQLLKIQAQSSQHQHPNPKHEPP